MRSIFIAVSLFLVASLQAQEIVHVPGRSGDILLKQKNFNDNSYVYLYNQHPTSESIEDQSIADLISHSVGGPVINPVSSRDGISVGSIFDKSAGNLFIAVDGLDYEDLAKVNDLKLFKSKDGQISGAAVHLKKTSYPQDQIATLATIASGFSPSVHGITGASWAAGAGQVEAFRAGAYPDFSNLFDGFSTSFNGKSLIFSASGDFQMAAALGVNQNVHFPSNNEFGLFFDGSLGRIRSIYSTGMDSSFLQKTWAELLATLQTTPLAMPGAKDVFSYDPIEGKINVDLVSKSIKASFELSKCRSFFIELQMLRNLMVALRSNPVFAGMTADHVPDLISFAFSSLKDVHASYGKNSAQATIAMYLLDEMFIESINVFSAIYNGRVSAQVAFLSNTAVQALHKDQEAKNAVYEVIGKKINHDKFVNNFPSIYVEKTTDFNSVCETLKAATTFEISCFEPVATHFFMYAEDNNGTNSTSNGTNPPIYYGNKDAGLFQISLWMPIIIGLGLLATIYLFCTLDVGADSMIYRSTNLRHAHIS